MKLIILVVDDHESALYGTVYALKQKYSEAAFYTAQTATDALAYIKRLTPKLVLMDLSIPSQAGDLASTQTGIQVLKFLLDNYPMINIVVQSVCIQALVRLLHPMSQHQAGFTTVDKSLSILEMLKSVDRSLQGCVSIPKEFSIGIEVKREWIQMIELAFIEGLQDHAIADRMSISESMVRHYWKKVQNLLEIPSENGQNIRIQTEIRAREIGLID